MLTWPVVYVEDCSAYTTLPADGEVSKTDFEQVAVEMLWAWTGRMFGSREVTVRPCRTPSREGTWHEVPRTPPLPGRHGSLGWFGTLGCGECMGGCSCGSQAIVGLMSPVASVTEVTIDGQTVDPDAYRIDNRHLLVRQDGGFWPRTQDLQRPIGEPGTWAVTYIYGLPVPRGGQLAAGLLACELAKMHVGDNTCQLPRRFSSISRQGVTVAALDTFEDIDQGHTGIWSIDAWVASVMKPPARSTVMSPDVPRRRRQTWP